LEKEELPQLNFNFRAKGMVKPPSLIPIPPEKIFWQWGKVGPFPKKGGPWRGDERKIFPNNYRQGN